MSDFARAAALMLDALDLPVDDRGAMLDRECAGDAELRCEVDALLDAHHRAGAFLETPPDTRDLADRPLVAGDRIGPYRLIGLLGEGGMGIVYLAEDTRLGRTVALKAISPRFAHDEKWRERLRREARAAAALTHPGVATVYALEEIDGRLLLAVEHVAGDTLRDKLKHERFSEEDTREIGRQLADALAVAHDRGIVHRDLKPENVMRTPGGAVKILDFGLAHLDAVAVTGTAASHDAVAPQVTQEGAVFGTPAYMAPEQLRGEPAGPAADIFALGVMLAELATGRHPFTGANPAATVARLLSAEPDLTGVPASLQPVIRSCVAKSTHDRFRSAHELRAALDRSQRGGARAVSRPGDALWWWQFHQAAASLFSVTLAIVVWTLRAQMPAAFGTPIMLASLIGALAATTLRLHLWFTARMYPGDAAAQHRRLTGGTKTADAVQALGVVAAALLLPESHAIALALLVASAVVLLVLSFVVEPATARAAKLS